jgi:hypothetical protein
MAQAVRLLIGLAAAALLGACGACQKPAPAPPAPTQETPTQIYDELVEAGCLAPDEGGPQAVLQESQSDVAPAWLACLFGGGTIRGCGAPCQ